MSTDTRLLAVQILKDVLPADGNGRSLREVLASPQRAALNPAERGLLTDLCFGVSRHYRFLDHWLGRQLQKPLKASARPVQLALLCGLYELWFTERAQHAVVNAYPDLCRQLKAPWAAGLTNAVLRKATREDPAALAETLPPPLRYSLPDWLWQQWQQDWGDQAQALAAASLQQPPLTLRVNRQQLTRDAALESLATAGIDAQPVAIAPFAITLQNPVPVQQLPGFGDGALSVQDAAAQLPAELIEVPANGRLLDACAAPGGKTGQLAERFPDATLVALDNDASRLRRVTDNLTRLGLAAQLIEGDASTPEPWWDGELFDAILLDAPCSATGILRRQPDVKWHRRPDDLTALVSLQARMLDALWPLIRPGGMLVYATCSLLDQENAAQISAFLTRHSDARDDTPPGTGSVPVSAGAQLFPPTPAGAGQHDGFYMARLRKN